MSSATLTLWIHDASFSNHHVIINDDLVPGLSVGDVIEIRQTNQELSPRMIEIGGKYGTNKSNRRIFVVPTFLEGDLKKKQSNLQISISTTVSATFGLRNRVYVRVTVVKDKESISADHIVIYFKDQYISRSDMWNLSRDLQGKCIWKGQKILFAGSLRVEIREIWINGKKKYSAYVSTKTKPIFRSESARYFLFLQMSKEMWEFEEDGELFFDKAVDGFLPELFKRWKNMCTRHSVTIILFTRIYYENIDSFSLSQSQKYHCSSKIQNITRNYKDYYETCLEHSLDFFKIVVNNLSSSECMSTILELKQELQRFKKDIMMHKKVNELYQENTDLAFASMSYALQGNVLEAINIVTKQLYNDYIDHDLSKTGTSIIIVTPGTGHFEVDEKMLEITAENLVNNGIGIDFICLSKPPLHMVPLFKYKKKSNNKINNFQDKEYFVAQSPKNLNPNSSSYNQNFFNSSKQHDSWIYAIPYFCQISYWNYKTKKQNTFVQSCKMHELQMMGIMENELSKIIIEYLPEINSFDNESEISSYCEKYDENVFKIDKKVDFFSNMGNLDQNNEKLTKNHSFIQKNGSENITFLNKNIKNKEKNSKELNHTCHIEYKKTTNFVSKAHTLSKKYLMQNLSNMGDLFSSQYLKSVPSTTSISSLSALVRLSSKKTTVKNKELDCNEANLHVTQNNPLCSHTSEAKFLDSKRDFAKNKSSTSILKQSEKNSNIRISLSSEKFQKFKLKKNPPWHVIQYPFNPSCNPLPSDIYYRRWKDVHTKQINMKKINWPSICSPASLPLSTEYFPSTEELQEFYQDYTYTITIDPEKVSFDQKSLLIELVNLRLDQGFQIVIGDSVLADDSNQIMLSQKKSVVSKLNKKNILDGPLDIFNKTIYLTLGDCQFHKITCDFSGHNIEVKRYVRKYNTIETLDYKYYSWLLFNNGYELKNISFFSHLYENQNWNYADQLIAGQEDNLNDSIKYWKYRYVFVPIDIKPTPVQQILAYSNTNALDLLNDEEIRILGILKIYELIKKGDYFNSSEKDKIKHISGKDTNHLDLIFTTLDISAFIMQELENFDSEYNFQNKENSIINEKLKMSDAKLSSIAQEIQGPKGIKFQDRRWHLKLHENCFIGMDLVTWLVDNFSDISTREEAVYYGNELLSKGLFEHVNKIHQFLDGYFFYRLKPEYSPSKTSKSWFGTRKVTPVNAVSENSSRSDSIIIPNNLTSVTNNKLSRIELSKYLIYDIDPQKQSYRPECIRLHYDRIYNPKSCYHIHVEWVNTTSRLLENMIQFWRRIAEKYGLKLIEVPIDEAYKNTDNNPLQSAISIKLAASPPSIPQSIKSNQDLISDPNFWCILLLKKFDFLLDFESVDRFPKSIDVIYSWGKLYKYSQYIHKSGAALAQIKNNNTILWLTNQLYLSRIGSMASVSNQFNIESQRTFKDLTLELNKLYTDFIKFCSDKVSLENFYKEILSKYT
ncbi:hypothetical protein PMAC_002731 [Pneumocystis sp. 'macacae']|nr:hypothetical protein PMAC_002731 [Pneumocystis sp. 'macacae']